MRRMRSVAVASLGLHILLFFLLDGYRELAFRVGRFFSYGNDISDILRIEGAGFAVLAIAVVGAGVPLRASLETVVAQGTRGSAECNEHCTRHC